MSGLTKNSILMLRSFGLVTSCLPEVNYLYLRFHEKCPCKKVWCNMAEVGVAHKM